MNRNLKISKAVGALFTALLGTAFHFLYAWSGENSLVGLFAPVSESIWEHIKLLYFPMLLYSIIEYFSFGKEYPCITSANMAGSLAGSLAIPVLFYSYSGILGFHSLFLDILTFLLSIILAYAVSYYFTLHCLPEKAVILIGLLYILLFAGFLYFTIFPPSFGLFLAPA